MNITTHGGDIYGAARRLGISPHQLLDFSASINPVGLSPKAARRLLRELHSVCHYPDQRQEELRSLVASAQKIDPECIVFGNGATQLLYVVARCLRPRKALLIAPGFSEYHAALMSVQARLTEFQLRPENQFVLDADWLLRALKKSDSDCILLANPNNPTGAIIPRDDLCRIASFCRKSQVNFIVDESFIDFSRERSLSELVAQNPQLIVIQSLTKFFALPGLRIGYLVAQRPVAKSLARAVEPWSVNTLALAAAAESIKDRGYRKRTLAMIAKEREFLLNGFRKVGWLEVYPSSVNFLLVRSRRKDLSGQTLRKQLERMRILIREGLGFEGLDPQFIRVAVRTRAENQRLLTALKVVSGQSAGSA